MPKVIDIVLILYGVSHDQEFFSYYEATKSDREEQQTIILTIERLQW